jgi:hypothetical protein
VEAITVQVSTRSNPMSKRIVAVAVTAVALAAPAAAVAGHGHGKGKGQEKAAAKQERKAAKGKKAVMFVFKGVYAGNGVVTVQKGNSHARRAGFVGTDVTFDLSGAKVVAAEFDNVPGLTAGDLQAGDVVLVQARLPRGTKAPAAPAATGEAAAPAVPSAIKARKVVDTTHPPVADEDEDEDEKEPAPAA